MGVDNDAKFVYGWILTCDIIEIFDQIIKHENLETDDDIEDDEIYNKLDLLLDHLSDKYNLYLDYASPYFDCGFEESVFFISLAEYASIKKVKELLNSELTEDVCKLLHSIDLKEEDIDMDCLPHVWQSFTNYHISVYLYNIKFIIFAFTNYYISFYLHNINLIIFTFTNYYISFSLI